MVGMHGIEIAREVLREGRLGLIRHAAGQEIRRHGHEHACLHIVLRGLYIEHSGSGTVVACPGDTVQKDPEVEHWNHFGPEGAESLRFELVEGAVHGTGELLRSPADLQEALRWRRTLCGGRRSTEPARVGLEPHVQLLARLRRSFREPVSLAHEARAIGVHRSHLTRRFTHEFGCSPQAYVRYKRAAWAAEALARGGETLTEISLLAGFADQSHCTRTFRRVFGTTPARWYRTTRA